MVWKAHMEQVENGTANELILILKVVYFFKKKLMQRNYDEIYD